MYVYMHYVCMYICEFNGKIKWIQLNQVTSNFWP